MYKRRPSKKRNTIVSIFIALILLYLFSNYIILSILRHKLNQNPDYEITVSSAYFNPFIGSYHINGVSVRETSDPTSIYLSVESIVPKIQWGALVLHGRLVGKIIFNQPNLSIINHPKKVKKISPPLSMEEQWQFFTKNIFPIGLNAIDIYNGNIAYTDFDQKQRPITSRIFNLNMHLTNASCVTSCKNMGANLAISAQLESQGQLYGLLDFNPTNQLPTARLDMKIENLNLKDYSHIISDTANVKLREGFADFYIHLDIQQNTIDGYIKPFFRAVDIKPKYDNIFNKMKAGLAQGIVKLFKNEETKETATKIPLSGKVNNPKTSILATIINALRHAFITALSHGFKK